MTPRSWTYGFRLTGSSFAHVQYCTTSDVWRTILNPNIRIPRWSWHGFMLIVYLAVTWQHKYQQLSHLYTSRYSDIVPLYTIFDKCCYLKIGLKDARDLRLSLSSNLFNQSSVDIQFSLSVFQRKTWFVYAMRNRL